MWRASSARASSRSWTSSAKPATAPVESGTSTIRSIRRSPRMIAGCMRDTVRPPDWASLARANGLSSPSASISSAPRSMTSAASRPSTACTKALLTSPSPRSGPRYHIGKGAASITCVNEFTAASVCRSRSETLARSSSAALTSKNHNRRVPACSPGGAGPPRTSNMRPVACARTLQETRAADARAISTIALILSRSSATIPTPSCARSDNDFGGARSPSSRMSRSSASTRPSDQTARGRDGMSSSKREWARAASSTC